MAVNYLWAVNGMTSYPQYQSLTDVVFNVQWCLNGDDDGVTGVIYGSTDVTYDPAKPFVAYNDLTIDLVINWVKDALGPEEVAKKEGEVAAIIAEKKQPPSQVSLPLPWNTPSPAPELSPTP